MKTDIKFKFLLISMLLLWSISTYAQPKVTSVDKQSLSEEIDYEGNIQLALQWKDKEGQHLLLTTETGIYRNETFAHENDGQDAQLFAYHYLITNGHAVLKWRVNDFIKDCPVDIEASFIKNTTKVTDLNKDGISEIWLMYKLVCHGDVSPLDMKIIMYEAMQKHAMRGQNKIKMSPTETMGGTYTFDQAFTQAPAVFRTYATSLWAKHITGK